MTASWPRARSVSTTWEPMKPAPPVTSTLTSDSPRPLRREGGVRAAGSVVERHAGMVRGDPVGVREIDRMTEDPVTRLVVHAAGRALEPVEDDVLVQTRGHVLG